MLLKLKSCKACGTRTPKVGFRRDKWGKDGWYCENCFNCIMYKEQRGFVNMKYHLRRKGKFKVIAK